MDEIWGFGGKKQKNASKADKREGITPIQRPPPDVSEGGGAGRKGKTRLIAPEGQCNQIGELDLRISACEVCRQLETLLGCSWSEFVAYITRKLEASGWTWEMFGNIWTVDHRLPVSAFDVSDPEQLLTCNPGSNLGVLTLEENAAKNGSFDPREEGSIPGVVAD